MNISFLSILLIFVGGGLGASSRFVMSKIMPNEVFPYATFTTNLLACILLGFLANHIISHSQRENLSYLLITGFCGAFSTFSTLNLELFNLLRQENYSHAIVYVLGNLVMGLGGIVIGYWIAKQL